MVLAVSGSGPRPFTRSRNSERNRVSRKNTPCGAPGSMSPDASEIANAGPSTRVTTPRSGPSDALAGDVHGWDMRSHATTADDVFRAGRRRPCQLAISGFPYGGSANTIGGMTAAPLLEIDDLHVSVDDSEILRGLSLTVGEGEVHALMGPNGS